MLLTHCIATAQQQLVTGFGTDSAVRCGNGEEQLLLSEPLILSPLRWWSRTPCLSRWPPYGFCAGVDKGQADSVTQKSGCHEPIRQSKQHNSPPILYQLWGLLFSTTPLPCHPWASLHYYLLLIHSPKYDTSPTHVSCPSSASGKWQQLELHYL